jgi:hypothetical protein
MVFWSAKHWIVDLGRQRSIRHWPSTQIFSFNSGPLWFSKGNESLEPDGGCWTCTSSTISGSGPEMDSHGQEKFTQSGQWEFSSKPRGQLAGHLEDPNTFSPSRCGRWFVKDDPDVKFATMAVYLARSVDHCAFLNNNSFLLGPWPTGPHYKYCLYNVDCLKTWT